MVLLVIFVIIIILATCEASETALKGQLLTFCTESSAWRVSDPCLEACGFPLTATCPSALYFILCPRITSLGHWKMPQNPCLYWLVYIFFFLYLLLHFVHTHAFVISRRWEALENRLFDQRYCLHAAHFKASTLIPIFCDRTLPVNNLKEVKKDSVCHKQKWNRYVWFESIGEVKFCYS